MERSEVNSKQVRLTSATVGAGALLAMGALGVATSISSGAQEPPEPAPPGPVTTSEVTTGETVTETSASNGPETSVAVPPITTPPVTVAFPEE